MKKVKGLVVFSAAATLLALGFEQKAEARVYFHSCKEAWAAGYGNIAIGEEGYSKHLDRDHDGVACEISRSKGAYRSHTADGTPLNKKQVASSSEVDTNDSEETTLSGWQQNGGNWSYYEDNSAVTDWKKINGTWYYFDGNGVMTTNWQKVSGAWYYMDNSGAMQTDWKEINNAWYYFNADGVMQANRWVGDYYLGSSGAMLVNTKTPDGYRVDASGKWIQDKK
ncbi:excalibur calcium-binding domain-containing protein [Granulicatella sp.]